MVGMSSYRLKKENGASKHRRQKSKLNVLCYLYKPYLYAFAPSGLPKQDSGHWWSSFFFGKQPGMTPLTEEAQQK